MVGLAAGLGAAVAAALLAFGGADPVSAGSAAPAATPARSSAPARAPRPVDYEPRPDNEVFTVANPHDHDGKPPLCQRCHVRGQAGVRTDPVALCAQCHEPGKMRHPFDVAQREPPADLPLGANGRIVCHTCHDPHAVKARKSGLRLEYRELCMRCHAGHRSAVGRMH